MRAIDKMASNLLDAIVLFGDSITQGSWNLNGIAARLSCQYIAHPSPRDIPVLCGERGWAHRSAMNPDVYCRKLDVINRGLSGFNTEWAIPVFEQVSWVDFFDQGARNAELNDQRL